MPPVVSIVGKSNSGKTTLIEKILPVIKSNGYRVATIKHDAHRFEVDVPGKDSWRHAQAGSDIVLISSAEKVAMIEKLEQEKEFSGLMDYLRDKDVDLIITEGYKSADAPKVEVCRKERSTELICKNGDNLIAVASDMTFAGIKCFDINDSNSIADFLIEKFIEGGN